MPEQLDLFAGGGVASPAPESAFDSWAPIDPARLSDRELIALLPQARQVDAPSLASEAARRRLPDAVPALEALCRRFSGFGLDREVTEQTAAISALGELGGRPAAAAITRLIVTNVVRGPGTRLALETAATLGCRLPPERVALFLRENDPQIREVACRCATGGAEVTVALIDLLSDLHESVAHAAAVALGRLGRREGGGALRRLARTSPSPEIIRALAEIAEDDDWVLLGRTASRWPGLAATVLAVLDESEAPRAAVVASGLRRSSQRHG